MSKEFEIVSEIALEKQEDVVICYMGGCLVAVCNKCKKHLAHDEAPFPGTDEQTKPIKEILYQKASSHKCK